VRVACDTDKIQEDPLDVGARRKMLSSVISTVIVVIIHSVCTCRRVFSGTAAHAAVEHQERRMIGRETKREGGLKKEGGRTGTSVSHTSGRERDAQCASCAHIHAAAPRRRSQTQFAGSDRVDCLLLELCIESLLKMLCECVLMLTFLNAGRVLDVDVGEVLFKLVTCAFSGPIGVEYDDPLRVIATYEMFVDGLGVDSDTVKVFLFLAQDVVPAGPCASIDARKRCRIVGHRGR
jgi:hypothetical protein